MELTMNYWAVLVAAIAHIAIGAMWYGPVFGKMWQKLMGFTEESMKSMPLTATQAMIGGFITALLFSYVLANFVAFMGITEAGAALELAFWIWLGFLATNTASSFLWEGKNFNLFLLNASNQLVSVVVMTLILALWK